MSDSEQPDVNPYEQLKTEMQAQYNELKSAFENSTKEKDEMIAQLQKSNQDLQRALLRSAFTEGPSQSAPEKTPEQEYEEKIKALYEKSKNYQRMI